MIDTSMYRAYAPQVFTATQRLEAEAAKRLREAEMAQRNRLMELQLSEAQAAAQDRTAQRSRVNQLQALAQRFYSPDTPSGDGVGPPEPRANFDWQGYTNAVAAFDPMQAMEIRKQMQPEVERPQNVAPGGALVDPRTGKVIYQAPFKPEAQKEDEFAMQLRAAGIDPASPDGQKLYRQLIERRLMPPSPQTVVLGAPQPVDLGNGQVGYVQPANRPGAQPQVMIGPDGKPFTKPVEGGNKVGAEIQRMNIAADAMDRLLGDYERMLKANNPRDPLVQMNPTKRAEMQSLQRNIQLQFKELQALGALAGPDLAIMESALANPFTMQGAFYGQDGLLAQIKQARNLIRVRKQAVADNPQVQKPQAEQNPDPLGLRSK